MINSRINKVTAEGDNIFIFQYIDSKGKQTEERKSFEEFLQPFVEPYTDQIEILKKSIDDKVKIEGYLDKEVLELSGRVNALEAEKNTLKDQVSHLLKEIEGKDLSQTTSSYQDAFEYFMKGELEEALDLLNEAKLEEEEKRAIESIKQKAETRILKAQILRIKNKFDEAGINYEKAVTLYSSWSNCIKAANYFYFINNSKKAQSYLHISLEKAVSDDERAWTLNNLALLQKSINEFKKAENSYEETLAIQRRLAQLDSQKYLPEMGLTLNNLGNLQRAKHEFEKAEASFEEALDIYMSLAEFNFQMYQPKLGLTFNNLGNLHNTNRHYHSAEYFYTEALQIFTSLAQLDPSEYKPKVAIIFNNFGNSKLYMGELEEAERFYKKSLQTYRELTHLNPKTYIHYVAGVLNNLALLQKKKKEFEKAESSFKESLQIYKILAQSNPPKYISIVAGSLHNLGTLNESKKEFEQAERYYKQSLSIRKELVQSNPKAYIPELGMTLASLGSFYHKSKNDRELSIKYAREAITLLEPLSHITYIQSYLRVAYSVFN
ncbi:tetratricopeptide repeat protein [Dokdonia sp.]|uniref:tetratricopeptide repeat protein n=1 Tax=Dokdonia sp. TaxID=2024995 RepID=UPI003265BCC3